MTGTYRLRCGACPAEFDVDARDDTVRCPSCGARHDADTDDGWDAPELTSNPANYRQSAPEVLMSPAWERGSV